LILRSLSLPGDTLRAFINHFENTLSQDSKISKSDLRTYLVNKGFPSDMDVDDHIEKARLNEIDSTNLKSQFLTFLYRLLQSWMPMMECSQWGDWLECTNRNSHTPRVQKFLRQLKAVDALSLEKTQPKRKERKIISHLNSPLRIRPSLSLLPSA
jgi:hypothetical protein